MGKAKHCVDCHFFLKEIRQQARFDSDITEAERQQARKGDYSWKRDFHALKCDFTVWDEGHEFESAQRHFLITQLDRRDTCFYWPHRPGMLMPAAKLLQERESAFARASTERRLTIAGLIIAALGLLGQAYMAGAQPLKLWPFR